MRNIVLSYLLLPLFVGFSLSVSAVPVASSTGSAPMAAVVEVGPASPPMRLNLNTADAYTLQKELNGIGKAKAEAIVAYREAHGGFGSVDELLEVQGIGGALLERNRDRLAVE